MKLVLADGSSFSGQPFGARRSVRGEVVFHTALTGYIEALTDPSYRGQILVLTYPLQGNYGVPAGPFESERVQVQGLIVADYTAHYSHHAALRSLGDWLFDANVPALSAVDTRTVTRRLRAAGTQAGAILDDANCAELEWHSAVGIDMDKVLALVEPPAIAVHLAPSRTAARILMIDTGAKASILRALQVRGSTVVQAPASAPWESLLDEVDGVVLTNGPGDPAALPWLTERLREVLRRDLPTFGICFGHQLLARCGGAETYKLPFGHRSHNQPILDLFSSRAYVTSQNHGYAVNPSSLPADWEATFVNLNDGTNEGIRHRSGRFMSVQFHPEAAGGPNDTAFLFDEYMRMVTALKRTRRERPIS